MQTKVIWENNIARFDDEVNRFVSNPKREILSVDYSTYTENDKPNFSALILYNE